MIRYAQCWEDTDVLLQALDVQPGDTCLSIASAGDNTLSLLTRDPRRVIAVDTRPQQLSCLELRIATYRALNHVELLELMGSRPSDRRHVLLDRCLGNMSPAARDFWRDHRTNVGRGIGHLGRFDRYLGLFRRWVLPLAHGRREVDALLTPKSPRDRCRYYDTRWDTWRWRALFRLFFSRAVMGRLGRSSQAFRYVRGGVADPMLERTHHALAELDPSCNPYVHWILRGTHGSDLPFALREENFEPIRDRLDRVEWHWSSVEDYARTLPGGSIDRFNLSNVFEYDSEEAYVRTLSELARVGRPGGRLVYWNLFVPRRRPAALADRLTPLTELSSTLHDQDRTFFYGDLIIEELEAPKRSGNR